MGKNETVKAKSGISMVEKAREVRRRRFNEAKKKLALGSKDESESDDD